MGNKISTTFTAEMEPQVEKEEVTVEVVLDIRVDEEQDKENSPGGGLPMPHENPEVEDGKNASNRNKPEFGIHVSAVLIAVKKKTASGVLVLSGLVKSPVRWVIKNIRELFPLPEGEARETELKNGFSVGLGVLGVVFGAALQNNWTASKSLSKTVTGFLEPTFALAMALLIITYKRPASEAQVIIARALMVPLTAVIPTFYFLLRASY